MRELIKNRGLASLLFLAVGPLSACGAGEQPISSSQAGGPSQVDQLGGVASRIYSGGSTALSTIASPPITSGGVVGSGGNRAAGGSSGAEAKSAGGASIKVGSAADDQATGGANVGSSAAGRTNAGGTAAPTSSSGGGETALGSAAAGGSSTGGSTSSGGTSSGNTSAGGLVHGAISTGGEATSNASRGTTSGGAANHGNATGGLAEAMTETGGRPNGGASTGGVIAGGHASGGAATGGTTTGGTASGGMSATAGTTGNCPGPNPNLFAMGADITDQEVASDSTRANLLTILKSHGFNYIRLRTFVDPKASDGNDKTNGYDGINHTVAFGKQIKDACMGLLIDFHYSDNWADPGKQCVPVAWQNYTTIADLATAVHDYTKDAITKLVAGGARPDMVQIGNETTPGMLLHRCDSGGQPTGNNPVTGSTSNWANLGALLKAGVQGVKDVDPNILISFHIDRGGDKATDSQGAALQTSINWLTNATKYVTPDAFGESCYQKYQGDPNSAANTKTTWTNTFTGLATKFPTIKLFAAEYGPLQREINDVVFSLPSDQGLGTFNWEPTTQGDWNTGHDLLRRSGTTYTAQTDLSLYDQMKLDYAGRL